MSEREPLPDERRSLTHHYAITDAGGQPHDYYIIVGLYPDGRLGEVAIRKRDGVDAVGVLLDQVAKMASFAIQRGAPAWEIGRNWAYMRFEPAGKTSNHEIPVALSPLDYAGRWLLKLWPAPK